MQPIKVDIGAHSRIYLDRADIDSAARFLIQRYGHEAASEAMANLDWMLSRSDAKGTANWMHVLRAIAKIYSKG